MGKYKCAEVDREELKVLMLEGLKEVEDEITWEGRRWAVGGGD